MLTLELAPNGADDVEKACFLQHAFSENNQELTNGELPHNGADVKSKGTERCPHEVYRLPIEGWGETIVFQLANKKWRAGIQKFGESEPEVIGDFKSQRSAGEAARTALAQYDKHGALVSVITDDIPKLEFHPFAGVFPQLAYDELEALKEDIRDNGLINPIVLYEGQILDGRNRYNACRLARVQPTFKEYEGNDPLGYVMSLNSARRDLSKTIRAVIAWGLSKDSVQGGKRQKHTERAFGYTRDEAAEKMHVSPTYVDNVAFLAKKAPELLREIMEGGGQEGGLTVKEAMRRYENQRAKEDNKARKAEAKANQIDKRGKCEPGDEFATGRAESKQLRQEFEETWPKFYKGYLHQFDPDDRAEIEDRIWQWVQDRQTERQG